MTTTTFPLKSPARTNGLARCVRTASDYEEAEEAHKVRRDAKRPICVSPSGSYTQTKATDWTEHSLGTLDLSIAKTERRRSKTNANKVRLIRSDERHPVGEVGQ